MLEVKSPRNIKKLTKQWNGVEGNKVRGYSAIKCGLFPLIKDRTTIDKRLDGIVVTGKEKSYCSILTVEEEESLVRHVKNKNRCLQGINKSGLTKLMLDILKIRQHVNKTKKGGRGFQKLSANAKRAVQTTR